jgi:ketosteroid isomerase-like protein
VTQDRDAEIVRRVRATFDAFNRGDYDEAVAFMHTDVELVRPGVQPPLHGVEEVRAWMEPSAFEYQVIEPIEITVAGPNKVLAYTNTRARGAGSGIEMEIDAWSVITVDDQSRVTRVETFLPHEEDQARRAAAVADRGSEG